MEKLNQIEYKLYGKRALFTDPVSKIGGEKYSYPIPTYQALKGITESIYWKPTIIWFVDRVRIMKKIRTEAQNVRTINYGGGNDLSIYSYLSNVEYQIQAHFEWSDYRTDLAIDRNENKHFFSTKRMIEKGGRRDIFLGTRECQGYVEPCHFGEEEGEYDGSGEAKFGLMFHGFDYPDETNKTEMYARFWTPLMSNGIIEFTRPEDCETRRYIKDALPRLIKTNVEDNPEGELL